MSPHFRIYDVVYICLRLTPFRRETCGCWR